MIHLPHQEYDLAYDHIHGDGVCVVFCAGFNSNRFGNKALALQACCQRLDAEYVRFDYSGHGDSGGDFADSSITQWLNDTLAIIDKVAVQEKVVLVGSSMGGWLALLAALARPQRVSGLLLIACAADMTRYYPERLAGRSVETDSKGRDYFQVPNDYDDQQPYRIYQHLLDDGEQWFLLHEEIAVNVPVRLLHGQQDDVVEWQRSQRLMEQLQSPDVNFTLVKSGDHRLSETTDLATLEAILEGLVALVRVNDQ